MSAKSRRAGQGDLLVSLPSRSRPAGVQLLRRFVMALILLIVATIVVLLEPNGYRDNVNQDGVDVIDAFYYATVTVTTTGYGDITPVSPLARVLNIVLVTPLRVGFLVLLVGTTMEVLANEGIRAIKDHRWRKTMRDHIVIMGYGTKGRAALRTLVASGTPAKNILVLDSREAAVAMANQDGAVALRGDATALTTLNRAEIASAKELIVTLDKDDSAILATLAVRQLNPSMHVVVAVSDERKTPMLYQSGADDVVGSSDVVGRLMGLSSVSPLLSTVLVDLLSSGEGLEVLRRPPHPSEVGKPYRESPQERFLGISRDGQLLHWFELGGNPIEADDILLVVRSPAFERANES